jgi:two-component system sensor histidine kinase UhpB
MSARGWSLWHHRRVSTIGSRYVRITSGTLSRRVFLVYAAILTVPVAVLIFAPVTISVPVSAGELVWLLGGFVAMLVLFNVLLHRQLRPLERLTAVMHTIDPLAPGQRIDVHARADEVISLAAAFNDMLDRLERERRESGRRALAAQEDERGRIARELHDEIGQAFTGMMLRCETLVRRAPEDLRPALEDLREAARDGAEDVRSIAQRLRPEALDQLGLQSALLALSNAVSEHAGIDVARNLERDLQLDAEQELVVYRVAQEGITNVVRHARARRIDLTLRRDGDHEVVLVVADDGVGLPTSADLGSTGIRGMRERALLVGGELRIGRRAEGGTEVRLRLPARVPS